MNRNQFEALSLLQPKLRKPVRLIEIALGTIILVICVFLYNLCHFDRFNQPTDTVRVEITGLSPAELTSTNCNWASPLNGEVAPHSKMVPAAGSHCESNRAVWVMPAYYNGCLQLTLTEAARKSIEKIHIVADGVDINSSGTTLWSDWMKSDQSKLFDTSRTTYFRALPHHPGTISDNIAMQFISRGAAHFANSTLAILLSVALFLLLFKQKTFHRLFVYCLIAPVAKRSGNKIYFFCGLLLVFVSLLYLENRDSFFFVKDDNFDQFLPIIEKGAQALLSNGRLSTWNACQYMGSPTTSLGIYALTYPLTYMSYAIADGLMHNRHLTIEVFAFIHLLIGYVATYFLLRELNVRSSISMIAAASFVLSGFFLIAGPSWYYVLPVAVWAPLMVLALNRFFRKEVAFLWTIGTGLVIGVFFHAGNAQMWFYAVVTCSIGVITATLSGLLKVKRVPAMLPALLIGIGIATPLILVQLSETAESIRSPNPEFFSGISWFNLLAPTQNLFANPAAPIQIRSNEEVYYFGGIFAFLTIAAFWYVFCRFTFTPKSHRAVNVFLKRNIWMVPGIFSLTMAAGYDGFLWNIFGCFPIFSKFTQSDKYFIYFALFGIITGAVIIERLLISKVLPKFAEPLVYFSMTTFLCVHVFTCTSSFYNFGDKPYPALPDGAQKLLNIGKENNAPHRLMSCAPERDSFPGYPASLMLNFPTLYGLFALEGYEPLIGMTPKMRNLITNFNQNPLLMAKEYGVQYLVFYKARPRQMFTAINDSEIFDDEMITPDRISWMETILPQSTLLKELPNGAIYELADAKPLAFDSAQPVHSLPIILDDNGIEIDVSKIAARTTVTVNFQYRPMFTATIDGTPTEIGADLYNRIVVPIEQNTKSLKIEYKVPWNKGLLAGGLLILMGIMTPLVKNFKKIGRRK